MEKVQLKSSLELLGALSSGPLMTCVFGCDVSFKHVVKSWPQAAKASKFRKWRVVEEVVTNYYRLDALRQSPRWRESRQPLVDTVSTVMEPLSIRAWEFFKANAGEYASLFHSAFNTHVRWACIELEVPVEIPNPFFSRLMMPIYAAGHLPCGLAGKDVVVDLAYAQSLTVSDLIVA